MSDTCDSRVRGPRLLRHSQQDQATTGTPPTSRGATPSRLTVQQGRLHSSPLRVKTTEALLWRMSGGTVWKEVHERNPKKTWGKPGGPRQTYLGVGGEKGEWGALHRVARQILGFARQSLTVSLASPPWRGHSMAGTPGPSGVSVLSRTLRRAAASLRLGFEELRPRR